MGCKQEGKGLEEGQMELFQKDRHCDLEEHLVRLLKERNMTVSTAESCTGGLISGAIVNAAGASDVLKESYVTYANEAKERLVGVRHETLEQFGAVSRETAEEMALGAARASGSNVGLSSTGIAGPAGGTKEKPVGLVYIGCSVNGKVQVKELHFHGNRMENRLHTVEEVLKFAVRMLE